MNPRHSLLQSATRGSASGNWNIFISARKTMDPRKNFKICYSDISGFRFQRTPKLGINFARIFALAIILLFLAGCQKKLPNGKYVGVDHVLDRMYHKKEYIFRENGEASFSLGIMADTGQNFGGPYSSGRWEVKDGRIIYRVDREFGGYEHTLWFEGNDLTDGSTTFKRQY